jgi:hypothetical protein
VIFTVRGVTHDAIPSVLDGVRIRVRESNRIRLGGSSQSSPSGTCKVPARPRLATLHEK